MLVLKKVELLLPSSETLVVLQSCLHSGEPQLLSLSQLSRCESSLMIDCGIALEQLYGSPNIRSNPQ